MKSRELSILGYPPFLWFLFFVVIPLSLVVILSFLTRGTYGGFDWILTFGNLGRVFEPVYLNIFLKSVKLSLLTAVSCLVLAYPMAWSMATASEPVRRFWILALAIPFMTNLIIRVYAIKLFVGIGGPLQNFLNWAGVIYDPFALSQNSVLVMYGMITTYLPFMVFPLYAALEKFDFSLVEAAQDLGASQTKILFSILIPNTSVAAINGFTLVFIPCLGEFVIPDLLGGAKSMLIGNLITEQFLKSRDWPFGAALSVVLIGLLILIPFALRRVFVRQRSV
ncbi:MAG: ABC transporter permease [Bdellovibrionota bacterium]